jgi:cell division initiation protein
MTPLDIQKKEFRHVFRGYSEEEVEAFLDLVAQEFENLIRENQELKEKIVQTEQSVARYREIEEAIKNTMVMAQKNTDELRHNAEKEASILLDRTRIDADQLAREAEQEAAGIIHEAEKRASEMTSEADKKLKQMVEDYNRIQREANIFRMRFRSFLESQIKILDGEEKEQPAKEKFDQEDS